MYVLIVVLVFFQYDIQPEVIFYDFNTQQECLAASNQITKDFKEGISSFANAADHVKFYIQCEKK